MVYSCCCIVFDVTYIVQVLHHYFPVFPFCFDVHQAALEFVGIVKYSALTSTFPSGTVDTLISSGRGSVWQTLQMLVYLYH